MIPSFFRWSTRFAVVVARLAATVMLAGGTSAVFSAAVASAMFARGDSARAFPFPFPFSIFGADFLGFSCGTDHIDITAYDRHGRQGCDSFSSSRGSMSGSASFTP